VNQHRRLATLVTDCGLDARSIPAELLTTVGSSVGTAMPVIMLGSAYASSRVGPYHQP
jgi:hypothetical protein